MSTVAYRVTHQTVYAYSGDVVHSHQLLHLAPRETERQTCVAHTISIDPPPTHSAVDVDSFGNPITRLEFDRPHQRLDVTTEMSVEVRGNADRVLKSEPWERVRTQLMYSGRPPGAERLEAMRYRAESPHVRIKQLFTDYAAGCFPAGRSVIDCADSLMHKLHDEMTYAPGETSVSTSLLEVLDKKRGVCQDYAHLMIACLRSRGLAARYVSGYLRTVPPAGQKALVGADASHAWVSVWCPLAGWVEFDPTNGVRADKDHITVAWGRDFSDVSPLRGVIVGGGQHQLSVRVTVTPLDGPMTAE
ncbi:transglutaminase-like putative cysteine protease [Povalibacter uvarum]|uniref:Transglutaminase-like putative cysteine protease n=1 Tax=Povalibacter uvarum TaxID=732238 RepID=A0A841HK81_9GAMM|nr:transglutaminase family protein [Povalibacter uvarum]MBB6093611.1 transglutaminase-like putative cysteine protease [Povalibacter uvarum]